MIKRIFPLLGALLLAACLPRDIQVPQSPLLPMLERKSGLIAYIGVDGNMYVSDQGGGKLTQLTEDALIPQGQGEPFLYYQNPTWARNGERLAFVGLGAEGEQVESRVMVAEMNDHSVDEIYSSESDHPVYLNWSPDHEILSFISTDISRERMLLQSVPAAGGERIVLDAGSPYYWSWAPDGSMMVVHAGGAAASVPEHVAFLDLDSMTEQAVEAEPAPSPSGGTQTFQAPAWSPDGSSIALTRTSEEGNEIIITDAAGENPRMVGTFTEKTAFAWSRDGRRLAYIDSEQALQAGTVGTLHVLDIESSEELVEEGNIIAFFWSPSGRELAYFILMQAEGEDGSSGGSDGSSQQGPQYVLTLQVLDVTNGESRELITYRPTQQFFSLLPYFDQYHQSATIWSPDNNNLVLSFLNSSGSPGIAVVPASGNLEPRFLAQGYLAFWSWE